MKYFLGLVLFFFVSATYAQTTYKIDSLLKQVDLKIKDSNSINALQELGSYYADNNTNKALAYYEQAEVLALQLKNNWKLGKINSLTGEIYLQKNDFKNALKYYQKASGYFDNVKDEVGITNVDIAISNIYFWNKEFKKAFEYFNKAFTNAQQRNDSLQITGLYSQRGMIYADQGNYDSALLYFKKAAAISKIIKDPVYLNKLSNIGTIYKLKKQTQLALTYYDNVLAGYLADKKSKLLNFASVYNNIAAAEAQAGNYTKAMDAFNKSNEYATRGAIPYIVMENYQNMAQMFASEKQYEQQIIYLQKYYHLKDSIFSTDNKNQLTQLEADYQIEKRNASLIKEQAAVIKSKSERNILFVIAVATLIVLLFLLFLYDKIRKSRKKIAEQKVELENLNEIKDRLFSVISHDLRNPMVALSTYLSLADNPAISADKKISYRNQTQQAINSTSNLLDNLLAWANMQVRKKQPGIRPIALEECIDDVLITLRSQAEQKNITVEKNITLATAPADSQIISIALRNIISNAVKFSNEGGKLIVSTYSKDGVHCIEVQDNGIGMTVNQVKSLQENQADSTIGTTGEKGSGLGIFLVKALLQQINGKLHIESVEGAGSKFTIAL